MVGKLALHKAFWGTDPIEVAGARLNSRSIETNNNMSGKGFGGGFGLGKMKELTEAFKKAQQGQEGGKELQEELEKMEIEGQAGGGMVKVVLTGNQEPIRTEISAEALKEGEEVLSDLVTAAMKEAYEKSTDTMRSRIEELTS